MIHRKIVIEIATLIVRENQPAYQANGPLFSLTRAFAGKHALLPLCRYMP